MKRADFNHKTTEFVKKLTEVLPPFSNNDILKAFNSTQEQFDEILNGKNEIGAIQFYNLSQMFNFSLKAFHEDKIDIEAIKKKNHLPKKYQTEFGTKNFMLSLSMEYIELVLGPEHRQNVLKYLQLPTLSDPSEEVSQKVSDDLNQYLDSIGFNKKDYIDMGHFCISRIMQTFFKDKSKLPPTIPEYLKYFFEEVMPERVEKNCIYKITKIEKNRIEYEAIINPLLEEKFANEKIGNENQCYKKVGGSKALIDHYCLNEAVATHPKCLHRGDDKCLFSIDF